MRPHFSQFSLHTSGNRRERAKREAAAAAEKEKKEGREKNKQKAVTVIVTSEGYYTESFYSSYFFTPAACLFHPVSVPFGSFLNFSSLFFSLCSCIAWTFSLSLWCMLMRAVKKEARRGRQKEWERESELDRQEEERERASERERERERERRCAMCSPFTKKANRQADRSMMAATTCITFARKKWEENDLRESIVKLSTSRSFFFSLP